MLCVAQTDGKRHFQVIIIIIFYLFTLQQSRKHPKSLTGRSPCEHTTQGRSFRNKLYYWPCKAKKFVFFLSSKANSFLNKKQNTIFTIANPKPH